MDKGEEAQKKAFREAKLVGEDVDRAREEIIAKAMRKAKRDRIKHAIINSGDFFIRLFRKENKEYPLIYDTNQGKGQKFYTPGRTASEISRTRKVLGYLSLGLGVTIVISGLGWWTIRGVAKKWEREVDLRARAYAESGELEKRLRGEYEQKIAGLTSSYQGSIDGLAGKIEGLKDALGSLTLKQTESADSLYRIENTLNGIYTGLDSYNKNLLDVLSNLNSTREKDYASIMQEIDKTRNEFSENKRLVEENSRYKRDNKKLTERLKKRGRVLGIF